MVIALNVAEKPSVAKEISQILSRGKLNRRNGYSKINPIYEFQEKIQGEKVEMKFTSVLGHLMSCDFPSPFDKKWQLIDPVKLFDMELSKKVSEGMEDLEKTLLNEARNAKYLVLWLDCDREGENIAFEVIHVCLKSNPRLKILRAHFSSLIEREIHRAMTTFTEPNELDSKAVDTRTELDLRIGAAYTRYLTLRYFNLYPILRESGSKTISYGPCQFPTLGFIVDRYWKIDKFIEEDFWSIECSLEQDSKKVEFNWSRVRLFDRLATTIIYEMCVEDPTAEITGVDAQPKRKYRPFPMTTVELQKQASRKLRMSSEETMKIAEKLYQTGYISYPRTETDAFQDGTDFMGLIQMQTNDESWGNYAGSLLNEESGKFMPPKKGNNNDNSHPPIHPTKYASNLQMKEKELYNFIVRHFLACCSKDAIGQETTVTMKITEETFTTKGLMIQEQNWLEVFPYEKWTDKNIPVFEVGQQFQPSSLLMHHGNTSPPSLLSEPDLITLMDSNGIGTDATIATHIKTVQDRGYAVKNKDNLFYPTTLGVALVDGYNSIGLSLSKPEMRSQTEKDLNLISNGTKTKEQVLKDNISMYRDIYFKVLQNAQLMDKSFEKYFEKGNQDQVDQNIQLCPSCKSNQLILKKGKEGKSYFSCEFPLNCNYRIYPSQRIRQIKKTNQICKICKPSPVYRLEFDFESGVYLEDFYEGCIGGCDELISGLITRCGGQISNIDSNPAKIQTNTNQNLNYLNNNSYNKGIQNNNPPKQNPAHNQVSSSNKINNTSYLNNNNKPSHNNLSKSNINNSDKELPTCPGHQEPCIQRTCKNGGPNDGREFYACKYPKEDQCKFFQWLDEIGGSGGISNKSTSSFNNGHSGGNSSSGCCFKCGKPGHFSNSCPDSGNSNSYQRDGNTKGKGSYSKPSPMPLTKKNHVSPKKSSRKCRNCKQEGHNKKNCPNG